MSTQLDFGDAVYAAFTLNHIRQDMKRDLERKDLPPADRRLILEKAGYLDRIIVDLVGEKPARLGQKIEGLGYPTTLVIGEWPDESLDYREVEGDTGAVDAMFEAEGAEVKHFRVLKQTGQMVEVYTSPEGGGEEVVRERERTLEQRPDKYSSARRTTPQPKYGKEPKYRISRT